jgi:signal transduction histidine kinase
LESLRIVNESLEIKVQESSDELVKAKEINQFKSIFQPFRRAGNVGKITGTGLGLAITKKCVDPLSGEISVNSQIDVGTEFVIVLPKVKD